MTRLTSGSPPQEGVCRIVARDVARFTAASSTPGMDFRAVSTRRTQAAQDMPPTETVVWGGPGSVGFIACLFERFPDDRPVYGLRFRKGRLAFLEVYGDVADAVDGAERLRYRHNAMLAGHAFNFNCSHPIFPFRRSSPRQAGRQKLLTETKFLLPEEAQTGIHRLRVVQ